MGDKEAQSDNKLVESASAGVGRRVRALREHFRETQDAFAKKCGVSRSYLSAIEREETKANAELLVGIAVEFPSVDTRWLLAGEGEMLVSNGAPEATSRNIDTVLFSKIADAVQVGITGAESINRRHFCWYTAMIYSRVTRAHRDEYEEAIRSAVDTLNRILLDDSAAWVAEKMNDPAQMQGEGMAMVLRTEYEDLKEKLGEHLGRYAGRPFWPGSELEDDFVCGRV